MNSLERAVKAGIVDRDQADVIKYTQSLRRREFLETTFTTVFSVGLAGGIVTSFMDTGQAPKMDERVNKEHPLPPEDKIKEADQIQAKQVTFGDMPARELKNASDIQEQVGGHTLAVEALHNLPEYQSAVKSRARIITARWASWGAFGSGIAGALTSAVAVKKAESGLYTAAEAVALGKGWNGYQTNAAIRDLKNPVKA